MFTMFGPGRLWQSDSVSVKSSALSQPRWAVPMPYGMLPRSETECASLSMANFTPASRAARM